MLALNLLALTALFAQPSAAQTWPPSETRLALTGPFVRAEGAFAGQQEPAELPSGLEPYDATQLRAMLDVLPAKQLQGLADYLRLDLSYSDNFQARLIRFGCQLDPRDPGLWPAAPSLEFYAPATFAPAQPIERQWLAEDSGLLKELQSRLARSQPPRLLHSGYRYDWSSGDVLRLADWSDPRRVIDNALNGFAPDLDLAEALVLRALDDASERETLAAFEQAYTDRSGNAYPGVSLYDAWASGIEIEMPDVDTLGLAQSLMGKLPAAWKAPVPNSEHAKLYGALSDFFVPAKQHRGLRDSLARSFAIGRPEYRDGFSPAHIDAFHLFWESAKSEPELALKRLPKPKQWQTFLGDLTLDLGRDAKNLAKAQTRRVYLERSELYVQSRLVALIDDMSLMERFDPARTGPTAPDLEKGD